MADNPLCPDFKIGTSVAGLMRLPDLGVPDPYDAPFDPFSVRNVRGDASLRGDGYPVSKWTWLALSREQLFTLMTFLNGGMNAAASATVYIRTRTNSQGADLWANYQAEMYVPVLTGAEGQPATDHVRGFVNVTIRFICKAAA